MAAVGTAEVFPVTLKQSYVLERSTHRDYASDPRESWVLSTAVLVRPGVDLRRLRRAYRKLRTRHESLRLRFEPSKSGWCAVIEPPGEGFVEVVDIGDVDDATFKAKIAGIAHAPLPVLGRVMAELIVARCGARGDVVVSRVNHAVADGHSMVVLTEDLLKYLLGMPVLGRAMTHAEFVSRHMLAPPGRAAEIAAFWEEMHRDPPTAPNIGRQAKGLAPNLHNLAPVENRRHSRTVSDQSFSRLKETAKRSGAGLASTVFSGFLESLCQNHDAEELMFTASVGRANPALDTFVGDLTQTPILRYRAAGAGGLADAARGVSRDLMAAIEHIQSEAVHRGTPHERALFEAGAHPRQFSCNQPAVLARQARSMFADGLGKKPGEETRWGQYVLTPVDVSRFEWIWYEMQFRVRETEGSRGFDFAYDGIGFDESEVDALSDRICELLELEPIGVLRA